MIAKGQDDELRRRMAQVCQRTLRRQAQESLERPFMRRRSRRASSACARWPSGRGLGPGAKAGALLGALRQLGERKVLVPSSLAGATYVGTFGSACCWPCCAVAAGGAAAQNGLSAARSLTIPPRSRLTIPKS